jgi:hypothetical protein
MGNSNTTTSTMEYKFRLEGNGMRTPLAPVQATSLYEAVKLARKACSHLTLSGWEIVEVSTGARYPAVGFYTKEGEKVFTNAAK